MQLSDVCWLLTATVSSPHQVFAPIAMLAVMFSLIMLLPEPKLNEQCSMVVQAPPAACVHEKPASPAIEDIMKLPAICVALSLMVTV